MLSMTGFGRGMSRDGRLEVVCELTSVNRKSLEASLTLPREWAAFESRVQELIRQRLERGKVQGTVKGQLLSGSASVGVDREAVVAVFEYLREIAGQLQVPWEPSAEMVAQIALAKGDSSSLPSDDAAVTVLCTAVADALTQLVEMRAAEGERLSRDLATRLELLDGLQRQVAVLTKDAAADYRTALMNRLQQAGLELELEDERVLREIALFADKADVTEEITRLKAHLEQFTEFLTLDGAVGRRMDFLCQELNREINTVGSKSNSIEATRLVIEFKNELERIREQIQNVE